MVHRLSFRHLTQFDPGQPGITVPVKLQVVGKEVMCEAKPDTGATYCTRVLCFEITKPKSQQTRAGCSLAKSWANTWVGELPC